MSQKHARDIWSELEDLSWLESREPSLPSLSGAVVDEVLNPHLMLPDDGHPEELFVCASTSIPLVREPLNDSGEPNRVRPDLINGQLGPVGDLHVLRGVVLVLHLLLAPEELLQEDQRAVILLGQEEALRKSGQRRGREGLTVFSTRYL